MIPLILSFRTFETNSRPRIAGGMTDIPKIIE
jgi:hypothetical protein